MERNYQGKLLLFGEYTVINGSSALAIPLESFSGRWAFNENANNQNLQDFAQYLDQLNTSQKTQIDTHQFIKDLKQGLFFDSNIPMGYGAGSSGAVCAAVYDRYCDQETKSINDIHVLKQYFIAMESYFHGKSSGLDPLVSYLNRAIYYKKNHFIKELDTKTNESIFLIDTKIQRKTAPLVEIYFEKMKHLDFQKINDELSHLNDFAIKSYLNQDMENLKITISKISKIQYEHFQEMIPKSFQRKWKDSLEQEANSLKLCGAGGGGFIIGFNFHE